MNRGKQYKWLIFLVYKYHNSTLYREQRKAVLSGHSRQLIFISECGHIWHTLHDPFFNFATISVQDSFIHSSLISNKSCWNPKYTPNHSQTRAIVSLNRLNLPRICWWLPFAVVTTSALCVVEVFIQILPKFERIFLIFVDLWHFVTNIAFQELRNVVYNWMGVIFP